jgi:hypothetical protein
MLSISKLVYPTPSDANLKVNSDGLGMLGEGGNDLNRFFFYKGLPKQSIDNRTSDPFNHIRSTGGYNNYPTTLTGVITLNNKGGINPFPTPPSHQNIQNPVSNNPVPLINALVDYPINPIINKLVDAQLPPTINPMSIPAPKSDPDEAFLKQMNAYQFKDYADGNLHEIEAKEKKR